MSIHKLTAQKSKDGQVELLCSDCKGPAEQQYGAQNKDQLVYVLSCSKCHAILGEWTTKDEMNRELKAFQAKA